MNIAVPPEDRAEMIRLYVDEQLSLRGVSERLFWAPSTVGGILHAAGIPLRSRGGTNNHLPQDAIDRTIELYNSGLSANEVGAILGIHHTSVRGRMRRAGVTTRTAADSQRLRYYRTAAAQGMDGLTARQASALRYVEDAPATTVEVARPLRLPTSAAYDVMMQLHARGLVKCKMRSRPGRRHNVWSRTDLAVQDIVRAAMTPPPHRRSGDVWLDIGPFRDWLNRLVRIEQGKDPAIPSGQVRGNGRSAEDPGAAAVCERLGLNERRLYAYRYEQQSVTISAADSVLLRAGDGTRLEDLWPELGSDSEVVHLPRSYQQRAEMEASELPAAA